MNDSVLAKWLRKELPEWRQCAALCTDPPIDDLLNALTALLALLREATVQLDTYGDYEYKAVLVARLRAILPPGETK